MPTYSYRCTECGEAFDIQQAFTDDTLTVCPNCGGALRKLFNTVGVSFNGSGFYRNDSRAKPPSEAGSSAGTSSDTAGTSSDSTSGPSTSGTAATAPAAPATAAKKDSKAPARAKE